ncbi:N-acetyltransferase [Pilimelia anulata]|uniref:N-acetyltransferase n=1 Tax=Pilimelia anulata TaxID=53371 RepID=A0A8J3BEV8_9ACTN|nr:GNAT family N-acetyltransferase [Pilimelia anulata]GGK08796.1 N-acetyltransferase [Pilimelia anulata]
MADSARLLAAFDDQLRFASESRPPAGVVTEWDGPLMRVVGQHRGFVCARRDPGLSGADLDALIARQRDFFADRGEAVEWKTYGHDRPADLPRRLAAAGFAPEDRETVVVAPTAAIAAPAAPPAGVRLREVSADADLDRIAAMQSAVWGEDMAWLAADLRARRTANPDGLRIVAAEAGPELVSAAWLVLTPGVDFAGLWGGSTAAPWRGRGVYRALVAHRAALAAAAGVPYLQVDASDDSRPILQRLGFTALTTTTPYVWSPAG